MMEGKQKTPSVIARLMGLDELPPQQPLNRQHKVLSDDYLRKTASIGLLEKRSLKDGRLSRISAQKQDKCVCSSEMEKIDRQIIWSTSDGKSNPSMVSADFSFPRQRNSRAEYSSQENKLFHLKGPDDMLENLCQTCGNLQRHYLHPDHSIKQFEDPRELQPQLRSGRLSDSTSPSISDDSDTEVYMKLDKMINQRTVLRSSEKVENTCRRTHIDPLDKLKPQLDLKDRSRHFSRNIVVLKPNSRQAQSCARNLLMPTSGMLSQSDSDNVYRGKISKRKNGNLNIEVPETASATSAMEPPRRSFRVTRGAAKQTDKVAKQSTGSSFGGLSGSRVTPDESSPNVYESMPCQSSFDCKRREQISYPFPSGSLFAMEAKKQIFERWKTTKNFQEVEVDGRRCTLGEMFVMHGGGARPKTSYVNSENYVSSSPFAYEGGKLELGSPLRVDSKHGLMDKHIRNLPRLELFKRSVIATGSSSLTTIGEASQNGSALEYQDATIEQQGSKNKASSREDSLQPMVTASLAPEEHQLEIAPSFFLVEDGHTSSDVSENLTPQRSSCDSPSEELNSWCTSDSNLAMNFKEINHLSPDSVLEPPFKEENPFASKYANNPLADLSGLAMKLDLLNSKSEETNSESSGMNVSGDEDSEKGPEGVPKLNEKVWRIFRLEESRDFLYLVDVLDEANLCGRNLDNLYETWHSMEFPVNPSLFEALEKKYGKQTSWLKSDRRLLFDHINSGLKEIMNSFMDIQISGKPLRRRFCPTLTRDEIEEELWMLFLNQEKEVSKDLSEKALGREIKWLELEEDISVICRELEEFVFDELAAELD